MEETILQAFDIKTHGLLLNSHWQIAEYESPTSECGFINADNAVLFALVDKKTEAVLIEGYVNKEDKQVFFTAGELTEKLKKEQNESFGTRLQERMNIEFSCMHLVQQTSKAWEYK